MKNILNVFYFNYSLVGVFTDKVLFFRFLLSDYCWRQLQQWLGRSFFLILLLIFSTSAFSQKIDIALYFDQSVNSLVFSSVTGSYVVIADSNYLKISKSDVLMISCKGDSVLVKSLNDTLGLFAKVEINGIDKDNMFKLKPSEPSLDARTYDDNLQISSRFRKLLIVNDVNIEKYLSGVVEAEGGPKSQIEYYKSQAVICRTYTFQNIERHTFEGFNLCDGVHCQAYKGKSIQNPEIITATFETAGKVITDTSKTLITATFHSNCGGITEGSENVWLKPLPYLISKKDDYCVNQRNAKWEKTIPAEKWKIYLEKYGAKIPAENYSELFKWNSNGRQMNYTFENIKIPLKDIRYDWKLRSAFFSIVPSGDNIILNGRGYGHGVGLCQEGAMKMAEKGINFEEIIKYYYYNVMTIPVDSIIPEIK